LRIPTHCGVCIAVDISVRRRLSRIFPTESNREFCGRKQGNCCPEQGSPSDPQPLLAEIVTVSMHDPANRKALLGARSPQSMSALSAADEIEKLDRLKKSGSISDTEFTHLRTELMQ
jgi:hypothetical protein